MYDLNKIRNEVKRLQRTLGQEGESLARKYLQNLNYTILQTNWRYKHWEIDIIASFDNTLHIIEVKTRSGTSGGYPEENVNRKKLMTLMKATEIYMSMDKTWTQVQFDVLAIDLSNSDPEYCFIEDVYL